MSSSTASTGATRSFFMCSTAAATLKLCSINESLPALSFESRRCLFLLKKNPAQERAGLIKNHLLGLCTEDHMAIVIPPSLAHSPSVGSESIVIGEPAVHRDRRGSVEPGKESQFLQVGGEDVGDHDRGDIG